MNVFGNSTVIYTYFTDTLVSNNSKVAFVAPLYDKQNLCFHLQSQNGILSYYFFPPTIQANWTVYVEIDQIGFSHEESFLSLRSVTQKVVPIGHVKDLPKVITIRINVSPSNKNHPRDTVETLQLITSELHTHIHNADVVFHVDGQDFPAHKWLLSLRSRVFKTMFEIDMEESKSGEIEITDCCTEVFKVFLQYLYTNQCEQDVMKNNLSGFLDISCKYMIDGLIANCVNALVADLTIHNAVETFSMLDCNDLSSARVDDFIANNFLQIVAETNIIKQDPDLLHKLSKKVSIKE